MARKPGYVDIVAANEDWVPEAAAGRDGVDYIEPPELVRASDVAKAEWERVVAELGRKGLLDDLDQAALIIYCRAVAEYDDLERVLAFEGFEYAVEGRNGVQWKNRPQVARRKEVVKMIMGIASDFGMTPYARVRLAAAKQGELFDPERLLAGGTPPRAANSDAAGD